MSKLAPAQVELEKTFSRVLDATKYKSLPAHSWAEHGSTIGVEAEHSLEVFKLLKEHSELDFSMLIDVTCIDWMDAREERFEVVYHLLSIDKNHRLCVRITASEDSPKVPSVRGLWPAANFLEREVFDMFGVVFEGHGDLRRILMYDEFEGHPLRKDYPVAKKQPRIELRVPELHNTSQDMNREQLVSLPVRQRIK